VAEWLRQAADIPGSFNAMGKRAKQKIQEYSMEKLVEGIQEAVRSVNRH
jgi:hypothetical protein